MHVSQLDHLNLSVANLDESVAWYGRVFGFEVVEGGVQDGRPWAILRSGDALLCCYENRELEHVDNMTRRSRGLHGINHFAFRIDDRESWLATIDRESLDLFYGGQIEWDHSDAWYIEDPTGYSIEVAFWRGGEKRFSAM